MTKATNVPFKPQAPNNFSDNKATAPLDVTWQKDIQASRPPMDIPHDELININDPVLGNGMMRPNDPVLGHGMMPPAEEYDPETGLPLVNGLPGFGPAIPHPNTKPNPGISPFEVMPEAPVFGPELPVAGEPGFIGPLPEGVPDPNLPPIPFLPGRPIGPEFPGMGGANNNNYPDALQPDTGDDTVRPGDDTGYVKVDTPADHKGFTAGMRLDEEMGAGISGECCGLTELKTMASLLENVTDRLQTLVEMEAAEAAGENNNKLSLDQNSIEQLARAIAQSISNAQEAGEGAEAGTPETEEVTISGGTQNSHQHNHVLSGQIEFPGLQEAMKKLIPDIQKQIMNKIKAAFQGIIDTSGIDAQTDPISNDETNK